MKINPWTLGLAAAGVVSLASAVQAEEATESVKTLVSSTTLSGYVNTSVHWNPGNLPGVANYAYAAGKQDRFNLDVVSLTIAKPLDEGQWSAGYKAQLWFGPDANALGTGSAAFLGNVNDINIKNAYVTLRAPVGNGLDFKLGVFDSILGYETHNAPDNPNYTRSWGLSLEPSELTGVLVSYRFNDIVSVSAGVANATSPGINGVVRNAAPAFGGQSQSEKAYTAAVTLTAPDSLGFLKGGTLTAGVIDGRAGSAAVFPTPKPDTTLIYVGATIPTPIESLKVGVAWDHSQQATTTAVNTTDTDAIAGYISWQATEKLKLNLRADYLDDGRDLLGFGASGWGAAAGAAGNAFAGEYLSATATIDYALWENVISRLEYRWDHDLSGGRHFAGTTAATGVNNANLLALNVIYKF